MFAIKKDLNFRKTSVLIAFIFGIVILNAQTLEPIYPPFIQNGKVLNGATIGGLSSPQFSEIDLNNDGIKDLYIFDKIGQLSLTYLNEGTPNVVAYKYAPEYEANFPNLIEWVLIRDYDGDGIGDIFAYSSTPGIPGIEAYKGYYDANNQIAFTPFNFTVGQYNIIYYPGSSGNNNLYVSSIDYPAIDDLDGDGDLDIVTFNIAGGIVEYYENQSVERGFGTDSLVYLLEDNCWGKFYESGIDKELDLSNDPDECALSFTSSEPRNGPHAGSTLLTIDLDNDGDKEIILGDISFTNLNLATNGGTPQQAHMTSQDIAFPNYDVPVDLALFPAAFSLDVNNDGAKDLIVSPNLGNDIGETYEVAWYYKNTNTTENPVYELQQKDLLVEDMIDFGTGAQPVFVDYNQDGLLDLVVGNKSFFVPGGMRNARVYLYLNIGTAQSPSYELVNDDLWNLNVFSNNAWRFTPTFGDLDGDGDLDALIGEEFGNLFYAENIAGEGQPFQFATPIFGYKNIDVGQVSKPQLIDVNRDGLLDLVIGERNGNLNYFENTGTAQNAEFTEDPTNRFFGFVDARMRGSITGYSAPIILEIDGTYQLFVGNEEGQLLQYDNLEGRLLDTFNQVTADYGALNVGREIHPAFADIDNDGRLELAIGNFRGGLNFFQTMIKSTATSLESIAKNIEFSIYPNPVQQELFIDLKKDLNPENILIYNLLGQVVINQPFTNKIDVSPLTKGMYLLKINTNKGWISQKIIKP